MKKVINVLLILMSFSLISCSKSSSTTTTTTPSSFQGNWTGRFTGTQDNGTWTATISATGVVTGTAYSAVFMGSSALNGTVTNQGSFTATVGSSTDGARFSGNLTGTTGSGTWVNTSAAMSGNWTGTKN